MRTTWPFLLLAGACTVSTAQPEVVAPLGFTVGDPVMVGYAPGQIDHVICVVTEPGGTIDVGTPSEGTITPTSADLVTGTPDATCPTAIGSNPKIGFAIFHWKTTTGQALAPFQHSKGNLATTPVDVELNGQAFTGYTVTIPHPVMAAGNYQLLDFDIAYKNPMSSSMTVPAPHVPYEIATVPAVMVLFPAAEKQETDSVGHSTVAVAPPAADTAVFVTPHGGDPVVLTTIHP